MSEETKDSELALNDQVIELHKRGGLSEEEFAIQQKVDAALDIAVNENGYEEIATWTDLLVAHDLVEHSSEFDDYSPARLRPFVKSWQDRHGGDRVPITWASGPHGKETYYIPRAALKMAEYQLIARLTEHGGSETKRANANALQTMTLGRHLSIAKKTIQAMRGVMVACIKLRRFGDASDSILVDEAMPGWICMQAGKELVDAIKTATKFMEQLDKEYPEAR